MRSYRFTKFLLNHLYTSPLRAVSSARSISYVCISGAAHLDNVKQPFHARRRNCRNNDCYLSTISNSLQVRYFSHSKFQAWPSSLPVSQADSGQSTLGVNNDAQNSSSLTPAAIVEQLDRFIVGQSPAKRAVAIALRNRWRRLRLPLPMRDEVMPKNILMIGPTGCGKTEIARRLAKLVDAPFLKVEATKFTELGYVGRDVEDIVKDLADAAASLVRARLRSQVLQDARKKAEQTLLVSLLGHSAVPETIQAFRGLLADGRLDDQMIDVDVPVSQAPTSSNRADGFLGHMASEALGALERHLRQGTKTERRRMRVGDARKVLEEAEVEKYLNSDMVSKAAVTLAEQSGIVFIDEIDKIVETPGSRILGGSVASGGVQRDLLPILEGSTVSTRHGTVSTEHVLFIASGAFMSNKPSDMIAELQGRLPIRVDLKGLTAADFYRILTEPETNLIRQQQVLLETEGVELVVTDAAIRTIAKRAEEANQLLDNIGARRLHTILERVLAEVNYAAPELAEEARAGGAACYRHVLDADAVNAVMEKILQKQDLSKYVI